MEVKLLILVFDLSNAKTFHFNFRMAQRFHLKTRSYGSGNNRHLVVSKRTTNYQSTVENLLSCGGENERYQLILPSNFEESQDE